MQNNHPLNKVVFIQKVAAFKHEVTSRTYAPDDLVRLAYVNNSWNDTIKNYSFHLFENRLRDVKRANIRILEKVCALVIESGVVWFLNVLLFSNTVLNCISLPLLVCQQRTSSVFITRFVLERIVEVGGRKLLESQLTESSNPATLRSGDTCLMLCAHSLSTPQFVNLFFEKIDQAGGTALLKSQLTATNKDGETCVLRSARYSPSPEVMKCVFEKIVEVGGEGLLKTQLTLTNNDGRTCLMLSHNYPCYPQVMTLVAVILYHVDLFQEQYTQLDQWYKRGLKEKAGIDDASWVPDPESIADAKRIVGR